MMNFPVEKEQTQVTAWLMKITSAQLSEVEGNK